MKWLALVLWAAPLAAYPLDGYARTGIRRLEGYRLVHEGKVQGAIRLVPGALLREDQVVLRLRGVNETFEITPSTPRAQALQAGLERIFAARDPSYAVAVLDISDPRNPRYAALRPNEKKIPGSVGKLLVAGGLLDAVRRRFPNDTGARERFLRETEVTADTFVYRDGKTVPVFNPGDARVVNKRVDVGDRYNLYEWLDHMMSQSSNAAASFMWKQAMLLRHFGERYPGDADAFFKETPKTALAQLALDVNEDPLRAAGLDPGQLRIGTFFTRSASAVVPGTASYACPNELLRWLIKVEQGRLVDAWASLEMKKLLYFARPRYRYASSPGLNKAAVFFKSGSLFQCKPGTSCGAYQGTAINLMHSVAIVESGERIYLVAMMSNVLGVNSAIEHQTIAGEIERLMQSGR